MNDWADEMAEKLNLSDLRYEVDIEDVAFALRGAKSQGLKECAKACQEMAITYEGSGDAFAASALARMAKRFFEAASKLEPTP